MTQLIKRYGNRLVLIQVTDDPRFYPDPLSKQEKYWLNKLGAIIEAVPGNPQNRRSAYTRKAAPFRIFQADGML